MFYTVVIRCSSEDVTCMRSCARVIVSTLGGEVGFPQPPSARQRATRLPHRLAHGIRRVEAPDVAMKLAALVLAGGQSTRMGTPKHLLPFPGDEPLFVDLLCRLRSSVPDMPCSISLRDADQARAVQDHARPTDLSIVIDDRAQSDIGPAAGLLAAHRRDPDAHWLVVACDYPLLPARAVAMLLAGFEEPVTCFANDEGWCEPLLSIWSPAALRALAANVEAGRTGPNATVRALAGKMLQPVEEWWLLNANTPAQWEHALAQRRRMDAQMMP